MLEIIAYIDKWREVVFYPLFFVVLALTYRYIIYKLAYSDFEEDREQNPDETPPIHL